MAIQLRRGVYNNFDPSKLLPGEVAVVQSGDPNTRNGKAVYIATLSGEIKRFAFVEDVEEIVYNITEGIVAQQLADLEERVEALESRGGGSGLTSEVKDALLAIFQHVAYADSSGQTYYDALEEALYPTVTTRTVSYSLSHVTSSNNASTVTSGASYTATLTASSGYTINTVTITMGGADVTSTVYSSGTITIPSVTGNIVITATAVASVSSITAVYTQSGTVYDTDALDSLKSDLVVTATYTGGTTSTIPGTDYTLSGSLTEGTSTITVSYGGKTTTFNVTVTVLPDERVLLYNWDFTESLTDTVEGVTAVLGANSGVTPLERTSAGVSFTAPTQRIAFPTSIAMDMSGKTLEVDVSNFDFKGSLDYHIRFILLNENINGSNAGWGPIIYKKNTGWAEYGTKSATTANGGWSPNWNDNLGINAFNGKTVKLVFGLDGHTTSLYLNNELVGTLTTIYHSNTRHRRLLIGGVNANGGTEAEGNQCYDMTITGVRIYQNAAEGDSEET